VAAEDTRHTRKLLSHFDIHTPLISYWGEKEKAKAEHVLKLLASGQRVALVSDAGTPGISDPGAVVVARALEEGYDVEAVPGPSALTAALSVSGLSTGEFTFIGFLPAKQGPRKRALEELSLEVRALVFYESPHRIADMLIDMEKVFGGERRVSVFKEITKMHETVYRGTLSEVLDRLEHETIAGEYLVVAEGRTGARATMEEALEEVRALMKRGLGRKEAVKTVSGQYKMSSKDLYSRSLGK
jgi:16S rRNA (cytidine1402-2'-O)-methyltransferase